MNFQEMEPGNFVHLIKRGVFFSATMCRRGGQLFAEVSKGKYVRLYADGSTSDPSVRIDIMHLDEAQVLHRDSFNKLLIEAGPKTKPVEPKALLPLFSNGD